MRDGHRLRWLQIICAALAVGLLAGCAGTDPGPPNVPGATAAAPRRAFDPPADFGATAAFMSGDGQVPVVRALDGLSGWALSSTGLARVDLAADTVAPAVFPDHPFIGSRSRPSASEPALGDPVVADTPVGRLALAAFPVEIPGQGTTAARRALELVAADSGTARKAFTVTVPLDESWLQPAAITSLSVRVVGVTGPIVVVTAATTAGAVTAGIDLMSRRIAWSAPDVAGQLIAGDTVITRYEDPLGGSAPELRGLAARDGTQRWAGVEGSGVGSMGPYRVLVEQRSLFNLRGGTLVLDPATGRPVRTPLGRRQSGWRCTYDQRAITVCQLDNLGKPYAVVGLDDSGTELWRILARPNAARVPPDVTTVWHGAVYGYTDAGPVVLDARTGADRTPNATAAPLLVNAYFGIAPAPGPTPESTPDYSSPTELIAVPTSA